MPRKKTPLADMSFLRSDCPLACSLDIIGDKWTLLVVRDLFAGKRRFSEIAESAERIKSNILADRLSRLEAAGLVTRRLYSERPPRYEYHLTETGRDLGPVVKAIALWGKKHIPGTRPPLFERRKTPEKNK
jgi:DNA-binding HxlR family transcriptional regulator